jgi:hypothetical protein
MDRFKWFDFLGALILLFSVTKSALTPQGVSGDADNLEAPLIPAGQRADLDHPLSEGLLDVPVDILGSSVKTFLEGNSRGISVQKGVVDEREGAVDPFLSQVSNSSLAPEMKASVDSLNHLCASGYSQICSSAMVPVLIR